jgi:hypothetical protein
MTKFVGKKKKKTKERERLTNFFDSTMQGVYFYFIFAKFVIMEICRNFHNFNGIFFALVKFCFFSGTFPVFKKIVWKNSGPRSGV